MRSRGKNGTIDPLTIVNQSQFRTSDVRMLIKAIAVLHQQKRLPWQKPITLLTVKDHASGSTLNGVGQDREQIVSVGATVTGEELALFVYQILYFAGPRHAVAAFSDASATRDCASAKTSSAAATENQVHKGMQVKNHTHFRGDDLRRIVKLVYAQEPRVRRFMGETPDFVFRRQHDLSDAEYRRRFTSLRGTNDIVSLSRSTPPMATIWVTDHVAGRKVAEFIYALLFYPIPKDGDEGMRDRVHMLRAIDRLSQASLQLRRKSPTNKEQRTCRKSLRRKNQQRSRH